MSKVIAEVGDEFIQFATDEADVVVKGNKGDAFCYMGQKPIEISDIFGEYIINGIGRWLKISNADCIFERLKLHNEILYNAFDKLDVYFKLSLIKKLFGWNWK